MDVSLKCCLYLSKLLISFFCVQLIYSMYLFNLNDSLFDFETFPFSEYNPILTKEMARVCFYFIFVYFALLTNKQFEFAPISSGNWSNWPCLWIIPRCRYWLLRTTMICGHLSHRIRVRIWIRADTSQSM